MSRRWKFRLLALVPTFVGLIAIVVVLIKQERLVFKNGLPVFQSPPIYLQEPGHEKTGHMYVYDAELGWWNIADWEATTFGKQLTTNSKHLRDREYDYEKPSGVKRILVLGDSYAWGYGVADDEIFTEVLEKRLETENKGCEVLNTGVSGWGTDQEYLYYAREGVKFDPDVVLLAFFIGNDPVNNTWSVQYGLNKPVYTDLKLTLANVPVPKPPADMKKAMHVGVHPMAMTALIMKKLAAECKKNGAKLVVMKFGVFLHPEDPSMLATEASFHSLVPAVTQSGARYLDLDKVFADRALATGPLTEGVDDGHWNPFGHRKVAEILYDYLTDQSLLK